MINQDGSRANHGVDFLLKLVVYIRPREDLVHGKRQGGGGRLMARNEKSDEVVDDALVRHFATRLQIHPVEHLAQEVASVRGCSIGAVLPPGFQHLERGRAQERNVFPVLFLLARVEHGRQDAEGFCAGLLENGIHGGDEWVQAVPVIRVEPEPHGAEGHRVESQSGKVLADVDGLRRALASPFEGELGGNLVHLVKHASDGHGAEGGHENSVSDPPVLLFYPPRLGMLAPVPRCVAGETYGKEPIVDHLSQLLSYY